MILTNDEDDYPSFVFILNAHYKPLVKHPVTLIIYLYNLYFAIWESSGFIKYTTTVLDKSLYIVCDLIITI